MEEELKQGLAEVLKQMTNGVAFAKEQAPDVVQQLLAYEMFVAMSFTIAMFILTALFGYATYRGAVDSEDYTIPAFFATLILAVFLLLNLTNAIQLHLAPKVFILEYTMRLAKGGC